MFFEVTNGKHQRDKISLKKDRHTGRISLFLGRVPVLYLDPWRRDVRLFKNRVYDYRSVELLFTIDGHASINRDREFTSIAKRARKKTKGKS